MGKEILYKRYIKGTNVYYGVDKYGLVVLCKDGEFIEMGEFLSEYLYNKLNLEDSRREYTPKERHELNLLICEMMGINRVRKALRMISRIANSIDTAIDLLSVDLIPTDKNEIHKKCDEFRDKYIGYIEVV